MLSEERRWGKGLGMVTLIHHETKLSYRESIYFYSQLETNSQNGPRHGDVKGGLGKGD